MNDFQNIKKLLLPLLKGLPIIGVCMFIALVAAYRINLYTNPVYESTIKIKLDDINQGASSAELYNNFDVFSHANKIATEVEMLKSKLLVEKALDQLDFDVSYFRVGKIRTQELYNNSPFYVSYNKEDGKVYDQMFRLAIVNEQNVVIKYGPEKDEIEIEASFGETITTADWSLTIHRNDSLLAARNSFDLIDNYQFQINSTPYILNTIIGENLDVVAVDKDVAVIRVSYKSEVAEKAAAFVNKLGKIYVEDYIETRTDAAGKTVKFIDEQLEHVSQELRASEVRLEQYRTQNNIINTKQETETDLRKIAQLKIQLSNLNMNQVALDTLEQYISKNSERFLELAPNFEAYNDLLSTELIKKIKFYQAEKRDLLLKYTKEDEKVKVIDEKIADVAEYIMESIKNSQKSITIKRQEIEKSIEEANKVFIGLPTKEKQMVILNREFMLNQKVYNFLTEKRTEASIVQAANISFHRIIQKAFVPKTPISPRKTLTCIVLGFLGLIVGIVIVYGKEFVGGKLSTREELEKISGLPLAGIIKKAKKIQETEDEFLSLATNLQMLNDICPHQAIAVSSTIAREGKTFIAKNLAKAYSALGWNVVIIDLNFRNPQLHHEFALNNDAGMAELVLGGSKISDVVQSIYNGLDLIPAGVVKQNPIQLVNNTVLKEVLENLKQQYDLVIVDTPAAALALEAIKIMESCEQVYYTVRANFTKSHLLLNADLIAEKYGFNNIQLLLNDTHQAFDFSGNYAGSQFTYRNGKMSWKQKIQHYINHYL